LTTAGTPLAPPTESAETGLYRIFVRDLVVPWRIGIYDHEHEGPQRVRFNVDLLAREASEFDADKYRQVVCYAGVVDRIRELADEGHVNLVETLASRVADLCLADERVVEATVRAEKLDAIDGVSAVGIEITRSKDVAAQNADRVVRFAGDN
jgi:dihydroneopterin aldolase|tara:strand:- start:109 stop:564 length:456 start_codon:yes stop_codon:yes gene_type:complete